MKRVICNQCRAEAAPDTFGVAPKGWVVVSVRGDYSENGNADYCSKACAVAALSTEPPAVAPTPAATEATLQ
jgi:hypothetical protein